LSILGMSHMQCFRITIDYYMDGKGRLQSMNIVEIQ
jgi:hypothetical protein